MADNSALVEVGAIERRILLVRGEKVIVDADLAGFYGVSTKRLNEQVKRNRGRFPDDFMFQLTRSEKSELVANCDHLSRLKFAKTLPYAFTEHGAIMAASVLNSRRAVQVSVFVVRAFVKIRRFLSEHAELARRLSQLERQHIPRASRPVFDDKPQWRPALPRTLNPASRRATLQPPFEYQAIQFARLLVRRTSPCWGSRPEQKRP